MTEPNAYDSKKFLALAKGQLRKIAAYVRDSEFDHAAYMRLAAGRDRLESIQWRSDLSDDVACTAALNAVREAFAGCEAAASVNRQARRDATMAALKADIAADNAKLCTYEREIRSMRNRRCI